MNVIFCSQYCHCVVQCCILWNIMMKSKTFHDRMRRHILILQLQRIYGRCFCSHTLYIEQNHLHRSKQVEDHACFITTPSSSVCQSASPGNRGQRSTASGAVTKTEEKHRRSASELGMLTEYFDWRTVVLLLTGYCFLPCFWGFDINVVAWTKLIKGHGPHKPFWKSNAGFNLTSMANHEKYVHSVSSSLAELILQNEVRKNPTNIMWTLY